MMSSRSGQKNLFVPIRAMHFTSADSSSRSCRISVIIINTITEWGLTPFQQYFSHFTADSSPIDVFYGFLVPVLYTIFFPRYWLLFHIDHKFFVQRWKTNDSNRIDLHKGSERILAMPGFELAIPGLPCRKLTITVKYLVLSVISDTDEQ